MNDQPAVFISYASQDVAAAARLCAALRAAGVEVWFDQAELAGGDAWDQKIRGQIKACALFIPVISANTNARREGYFRREWKVAVERTRDMDEGLPFLLPVVIDDTTDANAFVPEKFRDVQWTRLPGGDTPPAFVTRVRRLLAGEPSSVPASGRAPSAPSSAPRRRRFAWGWALLPILGIALAAAFFIFGPTRRRSAAAAAGDARPLSPARQLVAQARALVDRYDSNADDFAAAEGLVRKAKALDDNDAEVWALSSQINTSFRTRGFDHSPARDAAARADAERALRLDPQSIEALDALGRWQRDNDPDYTAAEATFKKVLALDPNRTTTMTVLSAIYARHGRAADAIAILERAKKDPERTPLADYLEFLNYFGIRQFDTAEKVLRESIAIQPSANSLTGLVMIDLTRDGDAAAAEAVLAAVPASYHSEHRILWAMAQTQLCARKPDAVVRTLSLMADDYFHDNWFEGPRDYLVGRAHALAGRKDAAILAWQQALSTVDARLRENQTNWRLHLMRGELLADLGRREEAWKEARLVEELPRRGGYESWDDSVVRIYAALGNGEQAFPVIRRLLRSRTSYWPLTSALLRTDPLWDPLRHDPHFSALLTVTPDT